MNEGPKFLHIYLTIPKEILEDILVNASINGYDGIVITCDHPTDRVRDDVLPLFEDASKTIDPDLVHSMPMPNLRAKDIVEKQDFSSEKASWKSIQWIQSLTNLPLICKGILSPLDAQIALDHHVQGIIVR